MSLSRHLSDEELQALLGTQDSDQLPNAVTDEEASVFGESGIAADPVLLLQKTVQVLSARVERMESELSLLRSQLSAYEQAYVPVELHPSALSRESAADVQALPSAPPPSQEPLAPRSAKHRKKKGMLTRLFE